MSGSMSASEMGLHVRVSPRGAKENLARCARGQVFQNKPGSEKGGSVSGSMSGSENGALRARKVNTSWKRVCALRTRKVFCQFFFENYFLEE